YNSRSVICDEPTRWRTGSTLTRTLNFDMSTIEAPVRLENIIYESRREAGQRYLIAFGYQMSFELVNMQYDYYLIETNTTDSNKYVAINLINTPIHPRIIRDQSWTSSQLQIITDGPVINSDLEDWGGTNTYNIIYTNGNSLRQNLGMANGPIGLWNFEKSGIDVSNNLRDLTFSATPTYAPGHAWGQYALQCGSVYATQADSAFQLTGAWT